MVKHLGEKSVWRRFPVPSLMLLAGAVLSLLAWSSRDFWYWELWLAAAFVAALAGHLWARTQTSGAEGGSRAGSKWPHVAAVLAVLAVGIVCRPYLPRVMDGLFFIGGLAVLLPAAPFLGRRFSIEAMWRFMLRVLLAALICLGVWVVISAGLWLAAVSAAFLLRIDLKEVFPKLLVAAPWLGAFLALRLMPDDVMRAPGEADFSRGAVRLLLHFLNWVAAPLLLLHGAILNVYALGILITRELPRGGVGWMVGSFAFIGAIVWLLAQAPVLRGRGGRLLRWFVRGWWWLLAAPFVLLVIGVWRRISDYGVTPPRYLLAEMAIWTGLALLLWVWRGARASNRALVALAGALLLSGALAGPFSARGMSVRSQMGALRAMLAEKGLLNAQGRLSSPVPYGTWTKKEKERLRSIRDEIRSLDAEHVFEDLIGKRNMSGDRPIPSFLAAHLPEPETVRYDTRSNPFWKVPANMEISLGQISVSYPYDKSITPALRARVDQKGVLLLERMVAHEGRKAGDGAPEFAVVWKLTPQRLLRAKKAEDAKGKTSRGYYPEPLDFEMPDGGHVLVRSFKVNICSDAHLKEGYKGCGIHDISFNLALPRP